MQNARTTDEHLFVPYLLQNLIFMNPTGAAACVLMSRDLAMSRDLTPLAHVVSTALVGCDPALMGMGPVPAIRAALDKVPTQCTS